MGLEDSVLNNRYLFSEEVDAAQVKKIVGSKNQKNARILDTETDEKWIQGIELNMVNTQKKLWASKYGKSPGKKLINFIQNQPELPPEPIPKHMKPNLAKPCSARTKKSQLGNAISCF